MRYMMVDEEGARTRCDSRVEKALEALYHRQLVRELRGSGGRPDVLAFRRLVYGVAQNTVKHQHRVFVKSDRVNILAPTGARDAVIERGFGKTRVVAAPRAPLFLGGRDNLPAADHGGSGIMIQSGNPDDGLHHVPVTCLR